MEKDLIRAIDAIESLVGEVELVSYGFPPNPNGFCYEVFEKQRYSTPGQLKTKLKRLDNALDNLSKDRASILKLA